jgi:hypothetical protein
MKFRIKQKRDGWFYLQQRIFPFFWSDLRDIGITTRFQFHETAVEMLRYLGDLQ